MEEKNITADKIADKLAEKLAQIEGNEIVIRTGAALVEREPSTVNFIGTIDAPARWVESKYGLNGKVYDDENESKVAVEWCRKKQNDCHVIVDREDGTIVLCTREHSYYMDTITGALAICDVFKEFGINNGEYRSSQYFADFFKMHRSYFESKAEANTLVTLLRCFEAKVNTELKDIDDRRGNKTMLREQVVNSNLPESFKLVLPIYKGLPKQTIEVEVYINPSNLACTLISAEAEDLKVSLRDEAIDGVIERIKAVAPLITIIEG